MERIDDLMERLKGQMPQMPDADALTDSIMAAIDTPLSAHRENENNE